MNQPVSNVQNTSESQSHFDKISHATSRELLIWSFVLAVLSGVLFMLAFGMVWSFQSEGEEITGNLVNAVLWMGGWVFSFISMALLVAGAVRWGTYGLAGSPTTLEPAQLMRKLDEINDAMHISETAKRIVFRDRDLQLLRSTIQADIRKGDFDGAIVLVDQLSQAYGYREEAENFRDEIISAQAAEMEAKISQAKAKLDEVIARHDFDLAMQLAGRIQRAYPNQPKTSNLTRYVLQAREQYKVNLEREFLSAAQCDDIEKAMELLKELDKYLTEEEAEPFRETAKGVIGKKRDNVGVQFKLALQDRDWIQAVQAGEQIISEFPNTRMAEEVRGMIDLLRERAAGQQAVTSTPTQTNT